MQKQAEVQRRRSFHLNELDQTSCWLRDCYGLDFPVDTFNLNQQKADD